MKSNEIIKKVFENRESRGKFRKSRKVKEGQERSGKVRGSQGRVREGSGNVGGSQGRVREGSGKVRGNRGKSTNFVKICGFKQLNAAKIMRGRSPGQDLQPQVSEQIENMQISGTLEILVFFPRRFLPNDFITCGLRLLGPVPPVSCGQELGEPSLL